MVNASWIGLKSELSKTDWWVGLCSEHIRAIYAFIADSSNYFPHL